MADGAISDPHFLPVLYELDDRSEWTNPAVWAKANPALGSIKKTDDLTAKVDRAKQNRNELSGVLCKEFNVRETVTPWLSFDDINNETTFDLEQFRGAYCIGGVDLSITTDLTCASLLFMRRGDDHKYITQMYWIPADRLTERVQQDKIPYDKWFGRGFIVPIKNQSPKQRIDGTAALLDCYVGLYEHYNEYTSAI